MTSSAARARRVYASSEFPDLRRTPAPLWELADLRRYASMSVQFSRGCPFDCEFCNVTAMFGHRPRTKTTAQVIAELDGLHRLGWRGTVFFVDDNFIGNKRALKEELLPALIQWQKGRRGIPFYTEASINLADDEELMRLMVEAGFDQVFIGIETPEEAGLAECNKRQNQKRDLVADVKRIQRAGLQVQGGFIVGFDSDTPTIFQRQIEFIQKSGIVTAMVGLLQAVPGHEAAPAAERRGPPDRANHRQQRGWDHQLHSADEPGDVARGLQESDGAHLCAGAVLPADPHLPARVPASENLRRVEAGAISWRSSTPTSVSAFLVANVSITGVCCSGRFSAVPPCSRWPSPSPSTATTSARPARCWNYDEDLSGRRNS